MRPFDQFRQLLKARRPAEALALAEQEAGKLGRSEFWLTQQAIALTVLGDTQAAIATANQALGLAPQNPYALLARAEAQRRAGRFDQALSDFGELANDDRVSSRARRGVLHCLACLERWPELLNLASQWSASPRWRVKALTGLQRWDEVIEACGAWLRDSPDAPEALWALLDAEIASADIDTVRQRYGKLARIPSRPPIYSELYASLLRRCGDDAAAAATYAKAANADDRRSLRRRQAFALAKSGQEAEALDIFEELLRITPEDTYVHSAYYAACKRLGAVARALDFYQKLLERHPDHKPLHGRIRKARRDLG
jgi:tetratricopeptide (TPR) repeat protein